MIDPQILQMLLQGGGDSPPATPVSGIGGGTPLSGLMLGEQGMGLGGGGGMLSGARVGMGPGMDTGGDLSQLLAMLQSVGGGVSGIGSVAAPSIGQVGGGALGAGFGSGGQLLPEQRMGLPQGTPGQAGMDGGKTAAGILGSIKELLGLGRTIGGALPSAATPTGGVGSFPEILRGSTFQDPLRELTAHDLSMLQGAPVQPFAGAPPAGQIMEGVGGGTSPLIGPITQAFPGAPPAGQIMEGVGGGAAAGGGGTNFFGGTGGFGAGLGALGGLAGALTAPNDPARAFSSLAAASSLASFLDPTGISEILALVGGGGGLLSSLFGGGHPTFQVQVPGYTSPITQTAGGARTSWKSYGEGVGALSPFEQALQAAKTPESLLTALNQQYSPFPGQFRVESHLPGMDIMNLGGTPFAPGWSPWTLAALQNPDVIRNLTVQAGALGAPAEQTQIEQSVRDFLLSRIA